MVTTDLVTYRHVAVCTDHGKPCPTMEESEQHVPGSSRVLADLSIPASPAQQGTLSMQAHGPQDPASARCF